MKLPEDIPACTSMDEDMPEAARAIARKRAYHKRWRDAHLGYRLRQAHRKAERRREAGAGLRPGGGCVKCELWLGCGGAFCERWQR